EAPSIAPFAKHFSCFVCVAINLEMKKASSTTPFALHEVVDPITFDDAPSSTSTPPKRDDERLPRGDSTTASASSAPPQLARNNDRFRSHDTSTVSDHQLLDALRSIAYMTSSPLQRQQYQSENSNIATSHRSNQGGAHRDSASSRTASRSSGATQVSNDDSVAALVDLLVAGVDAQRLVAMIETR
ncbi:Hypothetical protein, putative, partial [Bodo saltans]